MTNAQAAKALEQAGFVHKSTTQGGYQQWTHPDGSKVWIRPDGEIVRQGPKICPPGGGKKYAPRYDPQGQRTEEHNTGEKLGGEGLPDGEGK